MRNQFRWVLAAWLLGVGRLCGQTLPALEPSGSKPPLEKTESGEVPGGPLVGGLLAMANDSPGYRLWAQADYLLWWVRGAPLPVPLVTTGDPTVGFSPNLANSINTAGAIGQPGTEILLGGNSIRLPAASGMRLTLGGWIGDEERLGLEASGFILSRVTSRFSAMSDSAGAPPLYFPIFSDIAGAERAIPIADPLRAFSGDVAVTSTLQLWGAEGNVLCAIYRDADVDFAVLAGVRCADLRENLQIHNSTTDLLFGNVAIINDSFRTTNQFYGGQIGGRLGVRRDRLSLVLTGKLAVGSGQQLVDIQGNITQLGPNPLVPPGPGTFPGGLFAQPSNIGVHNANPLSVPLMVLPSLELKLAYQLSQRFRAFAGYDFLYWTNVVRPGNQISHHVNLTQNAVLDPNGAGTLVGAAEPAPQFGRSDFWAQGMSIGLEFRY